jgi:hypothetical protein
MNEKLNHAITVVSEVAQHAEASDSLNQRLLHAMDGMREEFDADLARLQEHQHQELTNIRQAFENRIREVWGAFASEYNAMNRVEPPRQEVQIATQAEASANDV